MFATHDTLAISTDVVAVHSSVTKDTFVESSSLVNVCCMCLSFVILGFYGGPSLCSACCYHSFHCKAVGGAIDWLANWQIV